MADVNKAFGISNDGLTVEKSDGTDGVWFGGGDEVPTHSAVIGSIYLRTTGDWYKQNGPGLTDWGIFTVDPDGFKYSKKMGSTGVSTIGKWLEIHHNNPSNLVPFSPPKTVELKALSVNTENLDTATFGIFKNGIQIDSLVITGVDTGLKVGLSYTILTSDKLSVQVTNGTAKRPVLHLFFG